MKHTAADLPCVVVVNEGALILEAVHANEKRIASQIRHILILSRPALGIDRTCHSTSFHADYTSNSVQPSSML